MDIHTFLIMIAPPLVLIAAIFVVFFWASKGKTPAFVEEADYQENNQSKIN
ncbi:cytochrome bd oxidase small subunit CydS [Salipaludibacillus sp. CF4.18]|uniref:cytochrome bd oxidase small subunit CydS n=1 Tax=Salipaludibacillus sp. CF4.18 TaxID=3373081 RepID=UPI003EE72384